MNHYTLMSMNEDKIKVIVDCLFCGYSQGIVLPKHDYNKWRAGALAQDAMPTLNAITRDVLITNMCTQCLNELYEDKGEEE